MNSATFKVFSAQSKKVCEKCMKNKMKSKNPRERKIQQNSQ